MEATAEQLWADLDKVRAAPRDEGTLELIATRPVVGERNVVEEAELDVADGVIGDSWSRRGKRPNPKSQVAVMSARAAAMIAGEREH